MKIIVAKSAFLAKSDLSTPDAILLHNETNLIQI